MTGVFACLASMTVVICLELLALSAGQRNGEHPGDAALEVFIAPSNGANPSEPVAVVRLVNPSDCPVVVGISLRRVFIPYWLTTNALTVRVPRWTAHRASLSPDAQSLVDVVGAGDTRRWLLPLASPEGHRPGRVVAVVGQCEGRLRVVRRRLPTAGPATAAIGRP